MPNDFDMADFMREIGFVPRDDRKSAVSSGIEKLVPTNFAGIMDAAAKIGLKVDEIRLDQDHPAELSNRHLLYLYSHHGLIVVEIGTGYQTPPKDYKDGNE